MKTLTYSRFFWSLAIVATISFNSVYNTVNAQERDVPARKGSANTLAKKKKKRRDSEPSKTAQPAPLNSAEQTKNNSDPTLIPSNRTVVGPLSAVSRDSAISGDGQRRVGMIYQLPDGQLKFMMFPENALKGTSRGGSENSKHDDGGIDGTNSYRNPLGNDAGAGDATLEKGTDSKKTAIEGENGTFDLDSLAKTPIEKFGHVFQMNDGRSYVLESTEDVEKPSALSGASRDEGLIFKKSGPVHTMRHVGKHVSGHFRAVGDRVFFVAAEWRGNFNKETAGRVFFEAVRHRMRLNNSAAASFHVKRDGFDPNGNQTRRLARDRYMVIGWYNVDRKKYYWFGLMSTSKTSCRYLRWDGVSGTTSGWKSISTRTNGQQIMLHFADDDNYGVTWRMEFTK